MRIFIAAKDSRRVSRLGKQGALAGCLLSFASLALGAGQSPSELLGDAQRLFAQGELAESLNIASRLWNGRADLQPMDSVTAGQLVAEIQYWAGDGRVAREVCESLLGQKLGLSVATRLSLRFRLLDIDSREQVRLAQLADLQLDDQGPEATEYREKTASQRAALLANVRTLAASIDKDVPGARGFAVHADRLVAETLILGGDAAGAAKRLKYLEHSLDRFGPDDMEDVIISMPILSLAMRLSGEMTASRKILDRALVLSEARVGRGHPLTQHIVSWMATEAEAAGSVERAVRMQSEMLNYARKWPDKRSVAQSMLEAAIRFTDWQKPDAAVDVLEKYLRLNLELLAEDPGELVSTTKSLNYELVNHEDIAARALARVLLSGESTLASSHPAYLRLLDVLGGFLEWADRPAAATLVRRRRLSLTQPGDVSRAARELLAEAAGAPPSAELASKLKDAAFSISFSDKDEVSALAVYRRAAEMSEAASGPASTETMLINLAAAGSLADLGKRREALQLILDYANRVPPSDKNHKDAAISLGMVADWLDSMSEHSIADDARAASDDHMRLFLNKSSRTIEDEKLLRLPLPTDSEAQSEQARDALPDRGEINADGSFSETRETKGITRQLAGNRTEGAVRAAAQSLARASSSGDYQKLTSAHVALGLAYHNDGRAALSVYHLLKALGIARASNLPVPADAQIIAEALQKQAHEVRAELDIGAAFRFLSEVPIHTDDDASKACAIWHSAFDTPGVTPETVRTVLAIATRSRNDARSGRQKTAARASELGICLSRLHRNMGDDATADTLILEAARDAPSPTMTASRLASQIVERRAGLSAALAAVTDARRRKLSSDDMEPLLKALGDRYREAKDYANAVKIDMERALMSRMIFDDEREPMATEIATELDVLESDYSLCGLKISIEDSPIDSSTGCALALRALRVQQVRVLLGDAGMPGTLVRGGETPALARGEKIRDAVKKLLESEIALNAFPIPSRGELLAETLTLTEAVRDSELSRAVNAVAARRRNSTVRSTQDLEQAAWWERQRDAMGAETGTPGFIRLLESELTAPIRKKMDLDPSLRDLGQRISSARASLQPSELALVYFIEKGAIFVWVVGRDTLALRQVSMEADALRTNINQILAACQPNPGIALSSRSVYIYSNWVLFEQLVGSVLSEGPLPQRLIIVADGVLRSLPFTTLVTEVPVQPEWQPEMSWTPSWLIKDTSVASFPSLDSLNLLTERGGRNSAHRLAAFGAPALAPFQTRVDWRDIYRDGQLNSALLQKLGRLESAEGELREIAGLLGAPSESVNTGMDMKEENLRAAVHEAEYVVFATHGLPRNTLDTLGDAALVFTPGSIESGMDGLLTAREIGSIDLDADVVVLSACSTAAASVPLGDDAYAGLAAAFIYAGARGVMVTLWPLVSNEAPILSRSLFKELTVTRDASPIEALRQAQWMSASGAAGPALRHPSAWAAYTLIGGRN